jgi:excisionase family DNA binding protein
MKDSGIKLANRLALRPAEAAEALGIGERTLRNWMRDEGLPFFRLSGVVLIKRNALEKWMEERENRTASADALAAKILEDVL